MIDHRERTENEKQADASGKTPWTKGWMGYGMTELPIVDPVRGTPTAAILCWNEEEGRYNEVG